MKVSIITATYNRGHLIGETVLSVLAQSHPNFEHIIVDDGSTDDTEDVVKKFNDERIKYFKRPRTANLSKLHNYGFQQSTGELIAILDSDDLWQKDKLKIILDIFSQNQEIKFVTHNIQYFKKANELQPNYYAWEKDFYKKIFSDVILFRILPFPIAVFKKSIFEEVGYMNERYFDGQQDFLFRVALKNKIYFCAKTLSFMRLHESNTTHSKKNNHYFINYYHSVFSLFIEGDIKPILFLKSFIKITIKFLNHLWSTISFKIN